MADRKVLQIVLTDEQREIVDLLLGVTKSKASPVVRQLLMDWAAKVTNLPGALRNGHCGSRQTLAGTDYCGAEPASYFMTTWKIFVCAACAQKMGPLITVEASDTHQAALDLARVRAAVEGARRSVRAKTLDDLRDELQEAAVAYTRARDAAPPAAGFDALVDRFRSDD